MSASFYDHLTETLKEIEADGLYKRERVITSQQFSEIDVAANGASSHVINFCANNYLGLANRPELIAAAKQALDRYGYGVA
jgi:glycine C-acetyltransferase